MIKRYNEFQNESANPEKIEAAEKMKLEPTPENAKKMADFQKENGGVIRINDDEKSKKLFTDLGYEIKTVNSSEFMDRKDIIDDIENFNDVNYVLIIIDDEPDNFEPEYDFEVAPDKFNQEEE